MGEQSRVFSWPDGSVLILIAIEILSVLIIRCKLFECLNAPSVFFVQIKIAFLGAFFGDVMPCSVVEQYQYFG
jgi:hypothetical protein